MVVFTDPIQRGNGNFSQAHFVLSRSAFQSYQHMYYKHTSSGGISQGKSAIEELSLIRSMPIPLVHLLTNIYIGACVKLGIKSTITLIIVGKRHHVRFFPSSPSEGNRSGNCFAGTVVDSDVTHPVRWDFYLLSHGGTHGTSRPTRYIVLIDENKFTYVSLDRFSAWLLLTLTLCPGLTAYSLSRTRFVTLIRVLLAPSPYLHHFIVMFIHSLHVLLLTGCTSLADAEIVCSRAKHHYDPQQGLDLSMADTATDTTEAANTLERLRQAFKPTHERMKRLMYFC